MNLYAVESSQSDSLSPEATSGPLFGVAKARNTRDETVDTVCRQKEFATPNVPRVILTVSASGDDVWQNTRQFRFAFQTPFFLIPPPLVGGDPLVFLSPPPHQPVFRCFCVRFEFLTPSPVRHHPNPFLPLKLDTNMSQLTLTSRHD